MLRYAITDRSLYSGSEERERLAALLDRSGLWIAEGIDLIQLREKDLPAGMLVSISRNIMQQIDLAGSSTRLFINSRPDIAFAAETHGVHLSSHDEALTPNDLRRLYAAARRKAPLISISCHTLDDVQRAHQNQVDAILFSPIFEKRLPDGSVLPGRGLDQLRAACLAAATIPVYALGGVTLQNAPSCFEAGVAGIAGIRLFHR